MLLFNTLRYCLAERLEYELNFIAHILHMPNSKQLIYLIYTTNPSLVQPIMFYSVHVSW